MSRRQDIATPTDQQEFPFAAPSTADAVEKPNRKQRRAAVTKMPAVEPVEKVERKPIIVKAISISPTAAPVPVAPPVPAVQPVVKAPRPAKVVIRPAETHRSTPFETLLHAELMRIYNFCLRLTLDAAKADDLTQEVFVSAAQETSEQPSATWLMRSAIEIFLKSRRYNRPRRPVAPPPHENGVHTKPALPIFDLPAEWKNVDDDHRLLLTALGGMEAEDRVAVVLKDVEDRSYADVGHILDLSESSARGRVSSARERLHAAVHRLEDGKKR